MKHLLAVLTILVMSAPAAAGEAVPGWTGMAVTRGQSGDGSAWLFVRAVRRGGPAEAAGVRVQDLITGIDRKPVSFRSDVDLLKWSAEIRPGQKLQLTVRRTEGERVLVLTVVKMPPDVYERWKLNFKLGQPPDHAPPR